MFQASYGTVESSMRKRGWEAITVDILNATLKPEKKMRIMYAANLNYERFGKYFSDLLKKDFVEEGENSEGKRVYQITERGKTLLAVLKEAERLMSFDKR
jgi:predicted transcriptional regulator